MPRMKECPKCGEDISDTYESDDPSVGIHGGWYCEKCEIALPIEDDYDDFD